MGDWIHVREEQKIAEAGGCHREGQGVNGEISRGNLKAKIGAGKHRATGRRRNINPRNGNPPLEYCWGGGGAWGLGEEEKQNGGGRRIATTDPPNKPPK